jgi:cell division protein ZapA
MSLQPVDIQIFGRLLKVNCPDEKHEELQVAVKDLNMRLQDLKIRSGVSNTEQLIFIVALNISYELNSTQSKLKNKNIKIEKKILSLQKKIEESLF